MKDGDRDERNNDCQGYLDREARMIQIRSSATSKRRSTDRVSYLLFLIIHYSFFFCHYVYCLLIVFHAPMVVGTWECMPVCGVC